MEWSGVGDDVTSGKRERLMALDVGERRIGVAISDETGTIASPLVTVARGRNDLAEIERLADTWQIARLVVGMPTGLSGREGPQAASVRAFAATLAELLGPEPVVDFADERLTTVIAERSMQETGVRRERRRERIDAVAASVILQGYLDSGRQRRAVAGRRKRGQGN